MIITDDFVDHGYIAPVERLHGALRFTYHPMLAERVDAIDRGLAELTPEKGHEVLRAAIKEHLRSWDLKRPADCTEGHKGEAVPVTLANVRRLPYRVFNRLYRIIAGLAASDPLPDGEADGEQEDGYVKALLESTASGKSLARTLVEHEAGN